MEGMRGAVIHGTGDVRFEERPDPVDRRAHRRRRPHRRGLRLRLGPVALPRHRSEVPQPTPIGHEYVGVVEAVGAAVTTVQARPVRRRRLPAPATTPARSAAPGMHANCLNGTGYDGCQAELIRDPERRRHPARHPGAAGRRPGPEPAGPVRRDVHRLARGGLRRRAARLAPWWSSATAPSASSGVLAAAQLGAERSSR